MEPPEYSGETAFPTILLMPAAFFSLILLIVGLVSATPELALSVIFPLAAFFFLQWQKHYRLTLYPDRLEIRTWFSAKSYVYEGLTVEVWTHNPATTRK